MTVYKNVQSSFTYNRQKLETAHISISRRMYKQTVVCPWTIYSAVKSKQLCACLIYFLYQRPSVRIRALVGSSWPTPNTGWGAGGQSRVGLAGARSSGQLASWPRPQSGLGGLLGGGASWGKEPQAFRTFCHSAICILPFHYIRQHSSNL